MEHALEQVTDNVDTQEKFKYLLTVIKSEDFKGFNIYAYREINVLCFAPNIIKTNNLLKELVIRIEQNESPFNVFDSFVSQRVAVHTFFIDEEGYCIDVQQHVEKSLEYLTKLSVYLITYDQQQADVHSRRTYSIILANTEAFLSYTQSLYNLSRLEV